MKKVKRLFDQFKPVHYVLDLVPNKENMTFSGTVIISGNKIGRPSERIVFHQKELKISNAKITYHSKNGDKEIDIVRINKHNKYDEIRLHADKLLYPGKYTVRISFSGKITRPMNGIYPCFFKVNGEEKKLIATQFESHHAREVFPCIDEPEAKATFDLSLTTPSNETVISNTPIKKQVKLKNDSSSIKTYFEETPHMSTYLLAFVYGELEYLEMKTKKGIKVRTYATADKVKYTKFALEVSVKFLDFYSEYFDIDYPLEKCDMIALPDFASGAMENWGCITYREQALLVDPENTSLGTKQYVAMVVAHELTHQWFGNLVTMQWWTDLWLNEGFASWFEYLAVDHIFPKWKMWTQFIVDEQQQALKLDALEHTHPVEVPIQNPDEIRTIFDAISYSKGSSIIHMLYNYLGEKDFQTGLRYYLKKHSYKNTVTNDLWDALEEASNKPVRDFMHAWTSQSGYPIINIEQENDETIISQSRFILNPKSKFKDDNVWPVPLLSNNKELPDILNSSSIVIKHLKEENFKLNLGGSGYYRTVYNASHLQSLVHQIKEGHFQPLDRLEILADASEAAKAGKFDASEVLNLIKSYSNESDNAVWDVIASSIASIRMAMDDENVRELLKPFVRNLVKKEITRLGWTSKSKDSHFDKLLRPTILSMASMAEDPEIVGYATKLFTEMHDPSEIKSELKSSGAHQKLRNEQIDPDLRGVVYGTAARVGSEAEYNKLLAMHNASDFSEERLNLCAALCGFKEEKLIKNTLNLINSDSVRLQDVAYWIAYSFTNRYARELTWEWMKDNWKWLQDNLGSDLSFYRMPVYAARGFSDFNFLTEYKKFFKKVLTPAFERSYNQGIEIVQMNASWKERDLKLVKNYLSKQKYN